MGIYQRKSLITKITILGVVVSLHSLTGASNVRAENSPLEIIRTTTNQALKVLSSSANRDKTQRQQQIEQMWVVVLPKFNTKEIAQRSLGVHWQNCLLYTSPSPRDS